MLRALEKRTCRSPTLENIDHQTAPSFQVFINFCGCHHFETDDIPLQSVLTQSSISSYGEPSHHIILITLKYLFSKEKISADDIQSLIYNKFIEEVLAPEAAVGLIMEDLRADYSKTVEILHASFTFSNNMHNPDDSENAQHIKTATERDHWATIYNALVYQQWIASGSTLPINVWHRVEKQADRTETDNEPQIKEEQKDISNLLTIAGGRGDPIDLTLSDNEI